MGFRLLLWQAIAGSLNMGESGFKVDPSSSSSSSSSVNALMYPKQRLTNYMVAKSAREKRRKVIADKKAKRCTASVSNLVSSIKDPKVTQIAREKRRQIIAAKKAMRCTSSNEVFSNNVQSSQRTKTKENKNSKKLQHEISEAARQKRQSSYE